AHLNTATINRLQAEFSQQFADCGLGANQPEVRATLSRIRRAGWDITEAQVTPGVMGIAAPLLDRGGEILGSLSLTIAAGERSEADLRRLVERVRACAEVVRATVHQEPM
ncbi:MAG: IclR family transcriptional regulator C-terminal domain-containing protein, partial [Caulobacteraceae bacterium]